MSPIVLGPTGQAPAARGVRDVRLGRIWLVTIEDDVQETIGDQLEAVGNVLVPGERKPRSMPLTLPIRGSAADSDVTAWGDRYRRQVRSLLDNPAARLPGIYLYTWFDPEINGWLAVGGGEIAYGDEGGPSLASYKLTLSDCYRIANRDSHREALRCQVSARYAATTPRDYRGAVFSVAFSAVGDLPTLWLPSDAYDVIDDSGDPLTTSDNVAAEGDVKTVIGVSDGQVVSFEQAEAAIYEDDVVALDRRGNVVIPVVEDPADEVGTAYLEANTGGIVKADYCDTNDPLTGLWMFVNDPYWNAGQPGYSLADDPYIDQSSTGGDTHIPLRVGAIRTGWRKNIVIPGHQSGEPSGSTNTRTQLINNSSFGTQTFWPATDGEHWWYVFSHRRHGLGVLPSFPAATPYADGSYQVSQFKTLIEGGGSDPILHLDEWGDGYELIYNFNQGEHKEYWFFPAANNVFFRFRFEIKWSLDPAGGYFALWGDIAGGGEVKLMERAGLQTIYPRSAGPSANWSHGPYGPLAGSFAQYESDYANFQVLVAGKASAYSTDLVTLFGSDLLGLWPLDAERKGTDLAAGQHDATMTTSVVGTAAGPGDLSATDLTGSNYGTTFLQPFVNGSVRTIFGWANRHSPGDTADALFGGDDAGNTGPELWIAGGGTNMRFRLDNTAGTVNWDNAWPGNDQWVFWMLVVDEPGNTVHLYLNGKLVTPTSDTGSSVPYSGSPGHFEIGARASGSDKFSGLVSQVGIANGDWSAYAFDLYAASSRQNYTLGGDLNPQDEYGWEEVYGSNYPFSGEDVPVLQNGRCRVRFVPFADPIPAVGSVGGSEGRFSWAIDVWQPGIGYVEKGRIAPRIDATQVDTLLGGRVVEWTRDRCVVRARFLESVGNKTIDVYVILQRGWRGPRFEAYTRPTTAVPTLRYAPFDNGDKTFETSFATVVGGAWTNVLTYDGAIHEPWGMLLPNANTEAPVVFVVGDGGVVATLVDDTTLYGSSRKGVKFDGSSGSGVTSWLGLDVRPWPSVPDSSAAGFEAQRCLADVRPFAELVAR